MIRFHFRVYYIVVGSVDEHTIKQPFLDYRLPKAPLKYILETALKRYCPAMSQSWSRTGLPSMLFLSLVEKSHPIVGLIF